VASLTFLVRLPGVVAGPGLAVYLGCCLRERARAGRVRVGGTLVALILPFAAVTAIHLWINHIKWGTWIDSPQVGAGLDRGNPLYIGLWGFLLSPGISIFTYSPLLLLLGWLARPLWLRSRALGAALLVMLACYLFVFAGWTSWTGLWSAPGPRYIFTPGVLLMLPLGLWIDHGLSWRHRAALGTVAVLGLAAQLPLMTANWAQTIELGDYFRYQPAFSFVFIPQASPILMSARTALAGHTDLWLVKLYRGWPSHPAQPGVALLLTAGCLAAIAGAAVWLRRCAHAASHR